MILSLRHISHLWACSLEMPFTLILGFRRVVAPVYRCIFMPSAFLGLPVSDVISGFTLFGLAFVPRLNRDTMLFILALRALVSEKGALALVDFGRL